MARTPELAPRSWQDKNNYRTAVRDSPVKPTHTTVEESQSSVINGRSHLWLKSTTNVSTVSSPPAATTTTGPFQLTRRRSSADPPNSPPRRSLRSLSPEGRFRVKVDPQFPGTPDALRSPSCHGGVTSSEEAAEELKKKFAVIGSRNKDEEVIESSGNADAKDYTRTTFGESLKKQTISARDSTIPTLASGEVITSTFGMRSSKQAKQPEMLEDTTIECSESSFSDASKRRSQIAEARVRTCSPERSSSMGSASKLDARIKSPERSSITGGISKLELRSRSPERSSSTKSISKLDGRSRSPERKLSTGSISKLDGRSRSPERKPSIGSISKLDGRSRSPERKSSIGGGSKVDARSKSPASVGSRGTFNVRLSIETSADDKTPKTTPAANRANIDASGVAESRSELPSKTASMGTLTTSESSSSRKNPVMANKSKSPGSDLSRSTTAATAGDESNVDDESFDPAYLKSKFAAMAAGAKPLVPPSPFHVQSWLRTTESGSGEIDAPPLTNGERCSPRKVVESSNGEASPVRKVVESSSYNETREASPVRKVVESSSFKETREAGPVHTVAELSLCKQNGFKSSGKTKQPAEISPPGTTMNISAEVSSASPKAKKSQAQRTRSNSPNGSRAVFPTTKAKAQNATDSGASAEATMKTTTEKMAALDPRESFRQSNSSSGLHTRESRGAVSSTVHKTSTKEIPVETLMSSSAAMTGIPCFDIVNGKLFKNDEVVRKVKKRSKTRAMKKPS